MNSSSSPTWINILSSNSTTPSYTIPSTSAPTKHHNPINQSKFPKPSSAPIVLNFENTNPSENLQQVNPLNLNREGEAVVYQSITSQRSTKKKTRTRPPSRICDHIIAERRPRDREQLSQLFIALSAIVPGLKKTDKTPILGDAIKYLKHLRERVETLEEKAAKRTMDPVVVVKKSKIIVEDEGSSNERSGSSDEQEEAPEIEARVVNNNILLRIHCGKQKGVLAKLLSKVESLNMVVVNTNVTPFGSSALDITIIAEMDKEFSLTVKEVATALRAALQ